MGVGRLKEGRDGKQGVLCERCERCERCESVKGLGGQVRGMESHGKSEERGGCIVG